MIESIMEVPRSSWHLDKDVYTSIKFHVQKNFSFQKCSPHKCPAMTCGPKALGEYTPAAVCRRGKIYIWDNACVWLEGVGACCVEGGEGEVDAGRGTLPHHYIRHIYTHWTLIQTGWLLIKRIFSRSNVDYSSIKVASEELSMSNCLVRCVNVEPSWLLTDLWSLYSNNSDRALWGHIHTIHNYVTQMSCWSRKGIPLPDSHSSRWGN